MTCEPTDRLMQTLRVRVPGATDASIELELFNVMDEFFRRTQAWLWNNEITLVEGETDYGLDTPVNSQLVRVLGVVHNDVRVPSVGQAGLIQSSLGRLDPEMTFPDGDVDYHPAIIDIGGDNQFTYSLFRPGYITTTFDPTPEQVQFPLKVWMALTVSRGCLECDCGDWQIPDWMWDAYFGDWADGVQSRMFSMIAKPWSNPTAAVYHGKRFRNRMAFRKQEALRGFTFGVPGWRFPQSGWT